MEVITELVKIFGSYRAENLGNDFFKLYSRPAYFPQLLTPIPCMLMGGRGTGKTTVLRSLSYEGQYQLAGGLAKSFNKQGYIGLYYKLETGLVSAFNGAGQTEEFWIKSFSHFINLQLCKSLIDFAIWYESIHRCTLVLNNDELLAFCIASGFNEVQTLEELRRQILLSIARLESQVNGAADVQDSPFSAIGSAPRRLVNVLKMTAELSDKIFYFLFDEYENLLHYQQMVLNTFIKQADSNLTFKIGIRDLGFKTRHTLNSDEQLVDPADYVLIEVSQGLSEKEFDTFAKEVVKSRFEALRSKGIEVPSDVSKLFEDLSEEQEAEKLGVGEIAAIVSKNLMLFGVKQAELDEYSSRDLALMQYIADSRERTLLDVFEDANKHTANWRNIVNNYGYAALFVLRKRKVGKSKFYSGWKTFLLLSAQNIRYFLQLVTNSLIEHAKENKTFLQQISAEIQTNVAMEVGQKNLFELEGLSTRGAQLMKLVLGMGQVLHQMAIKPKGHTPELTQFEISKTEASSAEVAEHVDQLLKAAVMHLAIIRTSGTKLGKPGDTRDFDFMLHPIYAPFFVYSHRRKRKFSITSDEFLALIDSPAIGIPTILANHNRTADLDLPEQLKLFGGYYEGNR